MKRASALEHDRFEDLDEESDTSDLQALITWVQQENACSVEEFISDDQELQTCVNIYGDEWIEEFLNSSVNLLCVKSKNCKQTCVTDYIK